MYKKNIKNVNFKLNKKIFVNNGSFKILNLCILCL